MKSKLLLPLFICLGQLAHAQTNIVCTDSVVGQVLLGNYDPSAYAAGITIGGPDTISQGINASVSPDSLHAILNQLGTFHNRNTSSDTSSPDTGIGAARRWAFNKFQQISIANDNRLLPAYLQFDTMICSMSRHRDVFAVLPGVDTSDKSVIIIEGHLDSRCADVCDTASVAKGIDDNGSGSALVLELARVMSRYTYKHTIVFLLTTGEEQGLYGAYAFAMYAHAKGIAIRGVMNNDIVGGIFCGHTSSAPSCSGYGDIDSTDVRLFSQGNFNSPHKGLARFIKLEYKEMVLPHATVPMTLNIMTPEDRTGRSGDHVPFRENGFTAMRFTSANEDGNADVTDTAYHDRQHTSGDSIGVDVTGDGVIDTYYVDFDYLARNAVINGNAAAMMAIGPQTPDFTLATTGGNLIIHITAHPEYLNYRIGVRTTTNDWDSVYTFTGSLYDTLIVPPSSSYKVSVASVDSNGIESLFSKEINTSVAAGVGIINAPVASVELLQNAPNPFDEATTISVVVNDAIPYKDAHIVITDMQGREVTRLPIKLENGINEVNYEHGYKASGTYIYTLVVDGKAIASRRMVFSN